MKNQKVLQFNIVSRLEHLRMVGLANARHVGDGAIIEEYQQERKKSSAFHQPPTKAMA
jgi:hypothetical protein